MFPQNKYLTNLYITATGSLYHFSGKLQIPKLKKNYRPVFLCSIQAKNTGYPFTLPEYPVNHVYKLQLLANHLLYNKFAVCRTFYYTYACMAEFRIEKITFVVVILHPCIKGSLKSLVPCNVFGSAFE